MKNLNEVYVNVAGTGENVLRDGTATCMGSKIINCQGTIVGPGVKDGEKYVLGSAQKIYYDVLCIDESGPYQFALKKGDSC